MPSVDEPVGKAETTRYAEGASVLILRMHLLSYS